MDQDWHGVKNGRRDGWIWMDQDWKQTCMWMDQDWIKTGSGARLDLDGWIKTGWIKTGSRLDQDVHVDGSRLAGWMQVSLSGFALF